MDPLEADVLRLVGSVYLKGRLYISIANPLVPGCKVTGADSRSDVAFVGMSGPVSHRFPYKLPSHLTKFQSRTIPVSIRNCRSVVARGVLGSRESTTAQP